MALVARYFSLGRSVMRMRIGEFGAWADALPEVQRVESLQLVRALTIAGQRGLSDEDYRQVMRDMEKPVRKALGRALSRAELDKMEAHLADVNRVLVELI